MRLRRYLIVFDPPTFVLDQREHPCGTLSQLFVFRRSKNFTSRFGILTAPTVPINHYFSPEHQQNRTEVLYHYSMLTYSRQITCFEHSIFLKVNESIPDTTQLRVTWIVTGCTGSQHKTRSAHMPPSQRRNPTTSFLTATTLVYAIGAGITAAAGTRLALQLFLVKMFKLHSFQLV